MLWTESFIEPAYKLKRFQAKNCPFYLLLLTKFKKTLFPPTAKAITLGRFTLTRHATEKWSSQSKAYQ